LPYLVHAKACKVIACEWNPASVEALKRNLELNKCVEKCEILAGDNRLVCFHGLNNNEFLSLIDLDLPI
jgi:tRNA G37 N-methylase Trm5